MDELQKTDLKKMLPTYLRAIGVTYRNNNMYNCPLCGSGTGKHGTAAFHVTEELWKCHACGKGGDIFTLAGELEKTTDFAKQVNAVYKALNIDEPRPNQERDYKMQQPIPQQKPSQNYTDFLRDCAQNGADYFKSRGLSAETISRFKLGTINTTTLSHYTASLQLSKGLRVGDVTIPYFNTKGEIVYFIARATNIEPNEKSNLPKFKKPPTEQAGAEPPYLTCDIATANEPIFITEAQIDALSIYEAGGKAVAVGGTGIDKLTADETWTTLKNSKLPVVLAFDNDEAGRKATNKAIETLKAAGVKYYLFPHVEGCKDINDILLNDRAKLVERVNEIKQECLPFIAHTIPTGELLDSIIAEINEDKEREAITTGFAGIDEILNGGLHPAFYVIGAISSLGKTALVLQIADNVAKQGRDVLFFSLEMSRKELVARSLSRGTCEYVNKFGTWYIDNKRVIPKAGLTVSNILLGNIANKEQAAALQYGQMMYKKEAGQHVYIAEGTGNVGYEEVRRMVAGHVFRHGIAPVVIVDYVQLLALADERNIADKQKIDQAIMELKRISRDFNTPVIGISSLNRQSYNEPMGMAAYKESGIIEYTADVLIGLNFKDLEKPIDETPADRKAGKARQQKDPLTVRAENDKKKKNAEPIEISFNVLKNRNGVTGKTTLHFISMFNYFEDAPKQKETAHKPQPATDKKGIETKQELDELAKLFGGEVIEVR